MASIVARFLNLNPAIKYIRYQWVDFSGILRARVLTKEHCLNSEAANNHGISINPVSMVMLANRSGMPGIKASGLEFLRPEWNSLKICTYSAEHACVMCEIYIPPNELRDNAICPRTRLSNIIKRLENEYNLEFRLGFEMEFLFLDTDLHAKKSVAGWSVAAGLRGPLLGVVQEIVRHLQDSNINVQQFHTEGQMGQFELSLGHLRIMNAIDAVTYAKEVIRNVAADRGLVATMIPKPVDERDSLGLHGHLSVSDTCERPEALMAGILEHLPALCAFGMPTYDSYHRVRDFKNMAGEWVCWGTQNRDVPIRRIDLRHWEFRFIDATANLYLVFAGILTAALSGKQQDLNLDIQDCTEYTTSLGQVGRARLGITTRLPETLEDALLALDGDHALKVSLGSGMIDQYIRVRSAELNLAGKMSEEDRRALFIEYF